ncbi:MAG: hypothetical protein R3202_09780 [Candidatus Competibacterales bacterium]|nr:hypothetical protein [Candidatus Competibacterales bacterium]
MKIEEQYIDVLQNLEAGILMIFSQTNKLTDREVLAAIERLIATYEAEKRNRDRIPMPPPGRAGRVYEHCRRLCEWRLGHRYLDDDPTAEPALPAYQLSIPELIACLKRLRKSIRFWHKQSGRQGYLQYIQGFSAGGNPQSGL